MNGILIINKSKGYTSHDIVYKIKKMFNVKVGHTGTLDPLATGVLPILLGEGTKLSKYLIDHDKEYEAVIKLGARTDTADAEGKIIEEKTVKKEKLSKENLQNVLNSFLGKQMQKPPMYSAIKLNGKKLYEYARKNQEIKVPLREIEIYQIYLLNVNIEKLEIQVKIHCSKGTYIRTLCENIAEKLNTVGYMKELNRTKVGKFSIENAITLDVLNIEKEELKSNKAEEILKKEYSKSFFTVEDFFYEKEKIIFNIEKQKLFLNGVQLNCNKPAGVYSIYTQNGKFVGSGVVENRLLKRDIVV